MAELKCNLCGAEFDHEHECSYKTLKQQNQKMRRALEFYAESENYSQSANDKGTGYPPEIINDGGYIARKALNEK